MRAVITTLVAVSVAVATWAICYLRERRNYVQAWAYLAMVTAERGTVKPDDMLTAFDHRERGIRNRALADYRRRQRGERGGGV